MYITMRISLSTLIQAFDMTFAPGEAGEAFDAFDAFNSEMLNTLAATLPGPPLHFQFTPRKGPWLIYEEPVEAEWASLSLFVRGLHPHRYDTPWTVNMCSMLLHLVKR